MCGHRSHWLSGSSSEKWAMAYPHWKHTMKTCPALTMGPTYPGMVRVTLQAFRTTSPLGGGGSYVTFCLGTKNSDSTSSARESMQSWWIHCNSIGYRPQLTNILNVTWIQAVNHMKSTSTRQRARIIRSGNICLKHCQAEMWRCS